MVVNTINDLVTLLDLADQDVIVLGSIANDSATSTDSGVGPGLVTTRAGDSVKNVQKVIADIENGITSGMTTTADREATAADREATAADLVETNQDTIDTAADRVQTGLDRTAVAADLVQTNDDQIAVAADAAQVATDKADVAANLVLTDADTDATAADRAAVAADLVQTNADVAASSVNASAASTSAAATAISVADAEAASATVNGVVTPLNSEILWPVSLTPFPTGWYDTTLRLLAGTSARAILSNNVIISYSANDITPQLVADFKGGVYGKDSVLSTFDNVLNHARNGNAVMVDADGLLKWATHNLLSYSQDFSNAAWNKNDLTVAANAATAPDGSLTADLLTVDAGSVSSYTALTLALGGVKNSFSAWVKPNGYNYVALGSAHGPGGSGRNVHFELTGAGAVLSANVYFTTSTIEAVSGGWYFLTVTFVPDLSSPRGLLIIPQPTSTYQSSYTGDGTSGSYVWGAHCYKSSLGGMVNNPNAAAGFETYVPTTNVVRYLPRENHHVYNGSAWVKEGYLHEPEAATNLVTYSQDFTNAAWVKENAAVSTFVGASPLGTNAAKTITGDGSPSGIAAMHFVSSAVGGSTYTWSFFAKAGTTDWVALGTYDGTVDTKQYFDLTNGVTGSEQNGTILSAGMIDYGNGWYLCHATRTIAIGATTVRHQINQATADLTLGNASNEYTLHVTQADLIEGSVPQSPIPTAGSTVTRAADTLTLPVANIPYPEPVVIGPEEITNAGGPFLDTTDWSPTASTLSVVGGNLRITGTGTFARAQISIAGLVVGKTYEITIGLASTQGSDSSFWLYNGFENQSVQSVSGVDQEYKLVATATATTGLLALYTTRNSDGTGEYSDWSTASLKEVNPLAVSFGYKSLVTYADTGAASVLEFVSWAVNPSNRIFVDLDTDGASTGEVNFNQVAVGVTDRVISNETSYSPGINVPMSIASRHGSTFINGAVDGTALTADTTPTEFPDLSTADLIIAPSGGPQVIQEFIMWGGTTGDIGDAGIEETSE